MGKQRGLTAGEILLARAAFADKIDYGRVKLTDGPGMEPLAVIAFAKGNPAITVESIVYFQQYYCPDFSATGANQASFIHEMTHVWQYQKRGLLGFGARYAADFLRAGRNANKMYIYGETEKLGDAMLEAQAAMVEHYSAALWSRNSPARTAKLAKLAKNLAGSKIYGL